MYHEATSQFTKKGRKIRFGFENQGSKQQHIAATSKSRDSKGGIRKERGGERKGKERKERKERTMLKI